MNLVTRTGLNALTIDDFAEALVLLKHRAGAIGLFKTMHAIEPATKAIGWELAEHIEARSGIAKSDANKRADAWRGK